MKRRHHPSGITSCCAVALTLLVAALAAQGKARDDQDLTSLTLEQLETVKVFSASRHLESEREAPSSVTVITRDEILRHGWRTLADVLNSVRGFYTANDRNYTYLGAEGFLRPGDFNSRILLLVDGHRLNDNLYGEALLGTEFPLDLDLVERIEIVRGPNSSLYGTNAMLGTINVVTRAAQVESRDIQVEAAGDFGSFEGRSGRLTSWLRHGRMTALLSGSMYEDPGAGRLFFPEFDRAVTNYGIAQNLDGDRYANTFTDISFGDWRIEALFGSRRKIIPNASYATNFNDPGSRTTDSRGYFDVGYKRTLTPKTEAELHAYFDEMHYAGTYAYGGTSSSGRYLEVDKADAESAGVEANLGHQFSRGRLSVGAQYDDSFRLHQLTYDEGGAVYLNDHRSLWMAAGYSEAEIRVLKPLTLRAGGRLDEYSGYGASFSPRAAAVLALGGTTDLKYIFGTAFRAPNAYETFYGDGVSLEPNFHLRPETIASHEVVVEHRFAPWLTATGDAFYSRLRNLIDQEVDPSNGLLQYVNAERDRSRGLGLEVEARHASGLSARASYTLSDACNEITNSRLSASPRHLGKVEAIAPLSRQASLGVDLLYASSQRSIQGTVVPSYFLADVSISTRPLWKSWEFSASVYNLLDRAWYTPAGPQILSPAVRQDGRTYRIKLLYRSPAREGGK